MEISPIDYRYGREIIKKIFDTEERLNRMLSVEAALVRALSHFSIVPEEVAKSISEKASTKYVKVQRVNELEKITKHDITAIIRALSEVSGNDARYIHYGATSNDIIDTATALQIRDALPYIEKNLENLLTVFVTLAEKHMNVAMTGRTHGQHAVPITLGLKMAVFAAEVKRHLERIKEIKPRIIVGKMSGAVGSGAGWHDYSIELESEVMNSLGLGLDIGSTQVISRDRYAEFIALLALIATSMEKFALEMRLLQQSEINELQEPFEEKQVGSSTMAQKRNPIISENICSIARFVRSFVITEYENMPLWHERDLSNSANERFIIPYSIILTDYIIWETAKIYSEATINSENMKENLYKSIEGITAENVLLYLTDKGMNRAEAHEIVRSLYFKSLKLKTGFKNLLITEDIITEEESKKLFNIDKYIASSITRTKYILSNIKKGVV
ncbi:MAG: adenylosuccinate lyase [Candidatus Thermoplasmatota archaeon]|jgi:adenylosuccinate lyase|nr:adenylosuccinate lyase [Candidatus Thermoplasmatota archaeon]MCL5963140.1 adenylosuccinate lyase [Candidatus Thermoplasmatota archaeon]